MATELNALLGDRYRMGKQIGRGGMGAIYEATDERLGRQVAVKMLHGHLLDRPDLRDRFMAEARTAASLHHPNVVTVYDSGEQGDQPYLVMECLPGTTLGDHLGHGPLDLAWFGSVATDVLAAVGAAHRAGIVHRDLKPGNILLATDGRAKVADFGIAKVLETADGSRDTTSMIVGTPAYLAPEQAHGGAITPRTDIYALGVLFYEAIGGERPALQPAPLRSLRPDVPAAMASAIHQAMELDPARRFSTVDEFAAALGLSQSAMATPPPGETVVLPAARPRARPGPRARRRNPSTPAWLAPALVLAAFATVVALAAAAVSTFGSDQPRSPAPELAAEMRALVPRLGPEDGPMAATAGSRLAAVANAVESGTGADEASSLLGDVMGWRAQGQLGPTATDKLVGLLQRVPGVSVPAAVSTTTTAAPATTAPPIVQIDTGDGDDEKKKGKGRDKDD